MLLAFWLGFGFWAAPISLVLYAPLRVLRNTIVELTPRPRRGRLHGEYTGTAWLTYLAQPEGIPDQAAQCQAVHDVDPANVLIRGGPAPMDNTDTLTKHPELADVVDQITPARTDKVLRSLNRKVDIDGEEPADVAFAWMKAEGFNTDPA